MLKSDKAKLSEDLQTRAMEIDTAEARPLQSQHASFLHIHVLPNHYKPCSALCLFCAPREKTTFLACQ